MVCGAGLTGNERLYCVMRPPWGVKASEGCQNSLGDMFQGVVMPCAGWPRRAGLGGVSCNNIFLPRGGPREALHGRRPQSYRHVFITLWRRQVHTHS